ncbi:TonB-dependent receptor [Sphingomonas sp.]|jgi:iron complex outermembrane receptor protein|uniref:TonB-dependent receptor n=1 Tax=Sphingomonas sp. TaxID=28214 RepID=UPI002DE1F7C9|nr:TonB-dependent receptor [Sphingomonas sp.]
MALFAAAGMMATSALAQTAGGSGAQPDRGAVPEEDIVVTAQRRGSERLQDVPISVGVVSQDFARENQIRNLSDVSVYIPGVLPSSDTPGLRQGFFAIRGIGSNDPTLGANPSVAVFLDDVYIGHPRIANLSLFDIERVEIAKGPQGTLYGRNTIGGAIAVVTRRPSLTQPEVQLNAQTVGYGESRLEAAAGAPLIEGTLGFRLAGQITDGSGRVKELTTGREVGYESTRNLRASVAWDASPALRFDVIGEYGRLTGPGAALTNVLPLPGHATTDPKGDVAYDTFGDNLVRARSLSGRATLDLGAATLTAITAYRSDDSFYAAEADYTTLNLVSQRIAVDLEQFSQEVRLASVGDAPLTWLLGASYYREKEREDVTITAGGDLLRLFGAPVPSSLRESQTRRGRENVDSYAAFGEATYAIVGGLRLTLGLRYTHDRVDQVVDTNRLLGPLRAVLRDGVYTPTDGPVRRRRSFSGWAPRVALDWKPADHVLLYASVTKGYKTGGFDPGRPTESSFSPEKVWSYEVGAKTAFLQNRVTFNVAGFTYDYSNLISRALVNTVLQLYESSIRGRGIESDLVIRPVRGVRLSNALTYIDAEYKDFLQGTEQLAGNRVPLPRFTSTTALDLDVPVAGLAAGVRLEHQRRSGSFSDPANTPDTAVGGYDLVNLRASVGSPDGRWELGIFGRNVLDRKFTIQHNVALPGLIETIAVSRGSYWGADLAIRF